MLVAFCEKHRSKVLAALPWIAAELAEGIGFASMLALIRERSGQRLHVPSSRTALRSKLNIYLPDSVCDRINRLCNSTGTVELPSAWGVFLCVRRVAIAMALHRGEPDLGVAQRYGVTTRYLRKLRRGIACADDLVDS